MRTVLSLVLALVFAGLIALPATAAGQAAVGSDCAGLKATMMWETIPATMEAGKSYSVSVAVKNTGTTSWEGQMPLYRLGGKSDAKSFGTLRVANTTAGGELGKNVIFKFTLTAPPTPGDYTIQYQMLKKRAAPKLPYWFGQVLSHPVSVT